MKNINWIHSIVLCFITGITVSCQPAVKPMKEGLWRGEFSVREYQIPFVFEVKGKGAGATSLTLINGADRFELNNIIFNNDSVTIPVDLYDVVLKGKLTDNSFDGQYIKKSGDKKITTNPFKAKYGAFSRFPAGNEPPSIPLAGTWDINIGDSANLEKAVGIFDQKGSQATGSILTPTGDYRFFEGTVQGKNFSLSTFGGSSPYLIEATLLNDSIFSGKFVTLRQTTKLEGKRNPKAALPDPYSVSHLKEGFSSIEFSFPNLEGNKISLSDLKYNGKVTIVTVLGSWCPNCLDENAYLSTWYKANKQRGVEIIGLGFERKNDLESAKKSLSLLKERLDIQYEILFAGQASTASASKALPALNGISAFPTTIFIDKKGNVRKVHTGFNGPATGKFHEEFKKEFNELIDQLLAEK
jgi:peroxiredoxin